MTTATATPYTPSTPPAAAPTEFLLPPTSPDVSEVVPAFVAAQFALGRAQKSATGNYGKYADLAACWDAIGPVFEAHQLAVQQRPLPCPSGIRLQTVIWHESGQWLADGGAIYPAGKPSDPQSVMAALTYARRGTLCANTGLTQEEDDGATAAKRPAAPKQPKVKLASVDDRNALEARIKALPDALAAEIGTTLRKGKVVWTQLSAEQLVEVDGWVSIAESQAADGG